MSEKIQFWMVFVVSIVFSIVGVPFAVFVTKTAADGGRGGAIGTALALGFLFINRDYGTKLFTALSRRLPNLQARIKQLRTQSDGKTPAAERPAEISEVKKEVNALVGAILIDSKGQQTQNRFLALATFIGTMLWGFGDLVADYLLKHS